MKIINNKSKIDHNITNVNNIKGHERFYFQNLNGLKKFNPCIELKGTLNIKISNNPIQKEVVEYKRKLNKYENPNTIRTIFPAYQEEKYISKTPSNIRKNINFEKSQITHSNQEPFIKKSKYTFKRMPFEIYKIQEDRKYIKPKLCKKFNNLKYNNLSQIYSLPGRIKRESDEIIDDDKSYKYRKFFQIKNSIQYKIKDLYKSEIFSESIKDDKKINCKSFIDKRYTKSSINIFKDLEF